MVRSCRSKVSIQSVENWTCAACRQKQQNYRLLTPFATLNRPHYSIKTPILYLSRRWATGEASSSLRTSNRDGKLPSIPARTRFAPSPTGYLHIGGLRTALFSYLLAKKTNGQFLLRIEDTDQKRLVPDAERRLCEDLQWAGLQWDEGPQIGGPYGPYKQSERKKLYEEHARQLLDADLAFRCFCTAQTSGSSSERAAYVTSGCYQDCSSISSEQAQDRAEAKKELFTVRLRRPPDADRRKYPDLIYGNIQRLKRSPSSGESGEDDTGVIVADTILIKSDGTPTYHFANVVDDHLMEITHVVRGTEWMASTPLHYDLYAAFGWQPPAFAHVGLLVDENKAKLSKRSRSGLVLDVRGMREELGVLPEVLCNFLALLGWSNPGRNDVLDMRDLINAFDLKFTKGNTIVKMEKLWYLQKQHVSQKCDTARSSGSLELLRPIIAQISKEASRAFPSGTTVPAATPLEGYCAQILLADSKSYSTPADYVNRNKYFFTFDQSLVPPHADFYDPNNQISSHHLQSFMDHLLSKFDWSQPYQKPLFPASTSTIAKTHANVEHVPHSVDAVSARIHAAINNAIWQTLCSPDLHMADAEGKQGRPTLHQYKSAHLPFTDQPLDLLAYAAHLCPPDAGPNVPMELLDRYKAMNRAIMRYLREKLSYGLPGPGVGMIMAILGYEECCRRLGVEIQDGKTGW